jgi:hypothetical protein
MGRLGKLSMSELGWQPVYIKEGEWADILAGFTEIYDGMRDTTDIRGLLPIILYKRAWTVAKDPSPKSNKWWLNIGRLMCPRLGANLLILL